MKVFFISAILLLIFLQSDRALAADDNYMNFNYKSKGKEITILNYYGKDTTVKIPVKIKGVKVTAIGDSAFLNNTRLKKVIIPSGIKSIGKNAFMNCSKLRSVILPDTLKDMGDYVFCNCIELENIVLPNNLKRVSNAAFEGCKNLTNIKLPNSLIEIGAIAFSECTSLKTINIPDKIDIIPGYCFYGCTNLEKLTLSDHITRINNLAFYNCRKLVTNIPAHLEYIDQYAFYNCESLPEIIIPLGIEYIYDRCFYGCKSAKVLQIPDSVTKLDEHAFDYCSSIKEVIIPETVSDIPYFIACNSLKTIKVNESNPNYTTVDGVIYNKDKTILLRYPPARSEDGFSIPDNVTTLSDYAFSGLSTITDLKIPQTVKQIGIGMFYGSTSIINVSFPSYLTEIPNFTFEDTMLKTVVIPENITKVGYMAYANCSELTSITIPSTVISIGEDWEGDEFWPFIGCIRLKEFVVDKDNKYYEAIDGVLYDKEKEGRRRLICYPSMKPDVNFTIPEGITKICDYAFYQCDNLHKLYLPNSLKRINRNYKNCKNLNIMVPASVKELSYYVEDHIFNECTNCYLYVIKDSEAYKTCIKYDIPYKIWK